MSTEDAIRQTMLAERRQRILSQATRMIHVTFQREGIHRYPLADTDPALATKDEYDVSFLAYPHRHMFHFKVSIQVFHNDREIEFIQFKRWLENTFKDGIMQLDYKSCEMISDELFEIISVRYPNRDIKITVSEDNENGATIYYPTKKSYQTVVI